VCVCVCVCVCERYRVMPDWETGGRETADVDAGAGPGSARMWRDE